MWRRGGKGGGEERSLRIVWNRTAKNLISVLQDFNSAPLLSTTAKLDAIRCKDEAHPSLFLRRPRPHFVNLLARSFFLHSLWAPSSRLSSSRASLNLRGKWRSGCPLVFPRREGFQRTRGLPSTESFPVCVSMHYLFFYENNLAI